MEKSYKRFTRRDLLFIGVLLLFGVVSMFVVRLFMNQNGAYVQVTIDGSSYGTYHLSGLDEQTIPITIDGIVTNTLLIEDGKAKMLSADCPDKLCVHQKAIDKRGETIVCLPNRVVVEVKGTKESVLDSVSQ